MLLSKGVNPNTPTEDGRTPLLLAAMEGHTAILEILLQCKCPVNTVYFDAITALSAAAANGHYTVMNKLLERGADPDLIGSQKPTALANCIYNGDLLGTILLLQHGSNIDQGKDNHQHPLQVAAIKNNGFMLQMLAGLDCDVNYLQKLLEEGTIYYFVPDDDVLESLEATAKVPKTMQALCRRAIRDLLTIPIMSKIMTLPVPKMLQDYIALKELDKLLPKNAVMKDGDDDSVFLHSPSSVHSPQPLGV